MVKTIKKEKKNVVYDISMPERTKGFAEPHFEFISEKKKPQKKPKMNKVNAKPAESQTLYKGAYEAYKKKLLGIVATFMEQEFGVIVEWVRELLNVRKKLKWLTMYIVLLVAGVTVLLIGVAKYIECLCLYLPCGIAYVIVGLAAIVIALIYRRMV